MAQWQVLLAFTMFRSEAYKCPLLNSWSCTIIVMEMLRSQQKLKAVAMQEELKQVPMLTIIRTHLVISSEKEVASVHISKTWWTICYETLWRCSPVVSSYACRCSIVTSIRIISWATSTQTLPRTIFLRWFVGSVSKRPSRGRDPSVQNKRLSINYQSLRLRRNIVKRKATRWRPHAVQYVVKT